MTLLAGAAEADITPPFPVDLLGYVRRPLAARSAYERAAGHGLRLPRRGQRRDRGHHRRRRGRADDRDGGSHPDSCRRTGRCDPAAVLLNSSHTHAAPWPGAIHQARWRVRRLDRHGARLLGVHPGPLCARSPARPPSAWRQRGSAAASARPRASPSTDANGRATAARSWAGTAKACATTRSWPSGSTASRARRSSPMPSPPSSRSPATRWSSGPMSKGRVRTSSGRSGGP